MKLSLLNFLVLTLLVFAACNKGVDFDKNENEKDDWEEKDYDGYDKDCFDFVYPVTYIMPTGYAISGNEETLWAAIETWYEQHPDAKEEATLQFPVDIIWGEDKIQTIANTEEMEAAWKKCDDKEKESCFKLVYPVTYTMPDGSSIAGNAEELKAAIKEWYITHDSAEKPVLNYPVQIVFPDNDVPLTINNAEEMSDLKKEKCDYDDKWDDDKKDCFNLMYPVTFTMPDGSTISGDDEEALWADIKSWYESHDSKEKPTLNYPVQIVFPDNDVPMTINNEEEMENVKKDC
ncbi:MAG: hypothetical protein NXI23_02895 [Bacteroidetes bacterium]|jgi:hypothetical protein|nr:hypothetical protein [Bacteroidota bacterium]